MDNFTTTIEFGKPASAIFKHITADVSKWWGRKDFQGNSIRPDDEFTIHHQGAHFSKQRLIEVVPGKKVIWLVTESKLEWLKDKSEWTGTKMIFELTANGNSTRLQFTHEGLTPDKECYDQCSRGWEMVIRQWLSDCITDKGN